MKIGVIGYGARISDITDCIFNFYMGIEIAAITDIDNDRVKQKLGNSSFK